MKNIELTELTLTQTRILDQICAVCDKYGNFELDDLRPLKEFGISRLDVKAEFVALRKMGYGIAQNKTTLFGGASFYGWCWNDFDRQGAAYKLAAEQAAAIAEVERILSK